MNGIRVSQREWVTENRGRFLERDFVLAAIKARFLRVPFEVHTAMLCHFVGDILIFRMPVGQETSHAREWGPGSSAKVVSLSCKNPHPWKARGAAPSRYVVSSFGVLFHECKAVTIETKSALSSTCRLGIAFQTLPSRTRPVTSFLGPPHCLKKNATLALAH